MRTKLFAGNLLITFILLVALSAIVGSLSMLSVTSLKSISDSKDRTTALYIAEAGMEKAVRELSIPVAYGGHGINWRTDGFNESFSGGNYTVRIADAGIVRQIMITSEGVYHETTRTLQACYDTRNVLPPPFNYALFWNNSAVTSTSLQVGDSFYDVNIVGDCYGNGNFEVVTNSSVADGGIFFPTGFGVTGSGSYATYEVNTPLPFPILDNTYYTNLISRYNGLITSLSFDTYTPASKDHVITLEGQSLGFKKINVPNPGSLTVYGSGEIVSQREITVDGSLRIFPASGETIALVANDQFNIEPKIGETVHLAPGVHLYSNNGELTLISDQTVTFEAHRALIMSNVRVRLNWPGSRIEDNSIIYLPPDATGTCLAGETEYYVADLNLSSNQTFHGSLISDSDSSSRYVKVAGRGLMGVIFSRINPVRLLLADIDGSVVADKVEYLFGQEALLSNIRWAPSFLPTIIPPGLTSEAFTFIPLTWTELHQP